MAREALDTPCKVNLHLGVHHERDGRGYHLVDSLMVPVALYDTVEVFDAPELSVRHEPALEVEPERTVVWKAVTLLAEALGLEPRVGVRVAARIPERAGLGGSSADAGAALRLLAARWGVDPLDPVVVGVARRVGADVAFFLDPVPGLYLGAGDVLVRRLPSLEVPLALVMPAGGGVSTKEAYDEFDRIGEPPASYDALCEALEARDVPRVAGLLRNNLAPAACALCEETREALSWLSAQEGVLAAQVTGSGACSFALCESDAAARAVAARAREGHGWRSWATKTVGFGEKVC